MIEEIINLFYELSREHKLIRSFKYDKLSFGAGVGDEALPQVFVEEPIMINQNNYDDNVSTVTINFDIVFSLSTLQNYNIEQPTPEHAQTLAQSIAGNFIVKINNKYKLWLEDIENEYQPYKVLSYSFLTLRNWYDNNCSGIRVTCTLQRKNPLDKCDVDSQFDPDKHFEINNLLPHIPTSDANGCVVFDFKLPTIDYGI